MSSGAVKSDLDFSDLSPIEIGVPISGARYLLREATGDVGTRYRNELMACTELVDGKPSRIRNMADVDLNLLSRCIYVEDGTKLMHVNTIRKWPNRVVRKLIDKVKEISELEEADDENALLAQRDDIDRKLEALKGEEVKNELDDTEDGSD